MVSERIGIAIITYNRRELVRDTVDAVRTYTRHPNCDFIVADDGSTDGTREMLEGMNVPVVTGANMRVAWNKNRALYLLAQIQRCGVIILLEDDTQPNRPGWEDDFIEGTRLWGHVNFLGGWMNSSVVSGIGTPADPYISQHVTAQCSAFSRESLDYGGYFDTRFKGYGHEHVEHTRRLIRCGYGGTDEMVNGEPQVRFAMLNGSLTVQKPASFYNKEQVEENLAVARVAMPDQTFRAPWRNKDELQQFREEMKTTIDRYPDGFEIRGRLGQTGSVLDVSSLATKSDTPTRSEAGQRPPPVQPRRRDDLSTPPPA